MRPKTKVIELPVHQLEDLLRRLETNGLRAEDCQLLQTLLHSYVHLTELLKNKNTSLARLRNLLFGPGSEKAKAVLGKILAAAEGSADVSETAGDAGETGAGESSSGSRKGKGHGRNAAVDYSGAERIKVSHETLRPGDSCPNCAKGTVYETSRPGVLVRLIGQAPVHARIYELQKLRCHLCGTVFTAQRPEEAGEEKFDATVGSMVALFKYGSGMPFNRFAGLQGGLGVPLPASTQWDLVHAQAENAEPVFEELIRQAAQGEVLYNDDTTARILELMGQRGRASASADEHDPSVRKGLFTSGVVSTREGRKIVLFFTGRKHAGENLNEVLSRRAKELGAPIQMCDALSRNVPGDFKTMLANCLVHGRRQFVDIFKEFPEECRTVLESLAVVYHNDALAREQALSPEARLRFHQAQSGPTMEKLYVWLKEQLEERVVERNSSLGGAIAYLLRHWEPLTLFLRVAGAPLDNNVAERALKKAILHRKNALFYKTSRGAHVGDLFMSLIHTCELSGGNPFEYLTALEGHAEQVQKAPKQWLPWNYRERLEGACCSALSP